MMNEKRTLWLLVGLFILSLTITSALAVKVEAGRIEPDTTCSWEWRGTYGGREYWCYHCCNHPDCLPDVCCDLYCEWR
jgi:hypothetical protein